MGGEGEREGGERDFLKWSVGISFSLAVCVSAGFQGSWFSVGCRGFLGPQEKSLPALSFLSPLAALTLLAGQRLHNCFPLLRWLWKGVRGAGGAG